MDTVYPEHDKLRAVKDEAQAIGSFIEWLQGTDRAVCEFTSGNRDNWAPIPMRIEQILAEYFEIDLDVIEDEKMAMLDELRAANEAP